MDTLLNIEEFGSILTSDLDLSCKDADLLVTLSKLNSVEHPEEILAATEGHDGPQLGW